MGRQRLSQAHILLIASLTTPLMFSARLALTQEGPSASKTPNQVPILAAPFAEGPETGIRFRPAYENLSPFLPNLGQTPSRPKFHTLNLAYPLSLTKNNAPSDIWQFAKVDEPQFKANSFIGDAPTEWLTNEIPYNTLHYRAPDLGDQLQYYGHRIPWAGRIILGVSRQAQSHPRVFSLLEVIDPGLSLDKPHTRSTGK